MCCALCVYKRLNPGPMYMEELKVFWKEVDDCIQAQMGRFTDIEIKRTKHECVWDQSESVIYSIRTIKLQILVKAQNDELCIHMIISNDKCMATQDFIGKLSAEFQSSDLKSIEYKGSFLGSLGGYAKNITIVIAVEHFCSKEGYLMEYYVTREHPYVFYIYKNKKTYGAKLRIFIAVPNTTDLAAILFHERFYMSMTAYPKATDSPLLFQNTAGLCEFIENELKNGSGPTITISQFLLEKVYYWNLFSDVLDSLPQLLMPTYIH